MHIITLQTGYIVPFTWGCFEGYICKKVLSDYLPVQAYYLCLAVGATEKGKRKPCLPCVLFGILMIQRCRHLLWSHSSLTAVLLLRPDPVCWTSPSFSDGGCPSPPTCPLICVEEGRGHCCWSETGFKFKFMNQFWLFSVDFYRVQSWALI